jgi:hypothetical protein
MDRILRVVLWGMVTAAVGMAPPLGRTAPIDEDGRVISPGVALPAEPSPSAETPPSLLLDPQPNSTDRWPSNARSSANAGRATGDLKPDGRPMPAPVKMASTLETAAANGDRSEQMEQIARQADRQTRHGFDLAGRGACFAARLEFLSALKLVAEGLDTEQKTGVHGRALTAALTAMKEADDFLPGGSRLETDVDLLGIIANHSTPVLRAETGNVTSMTALKCYFTFAQEQFTAAAGHEVAASMALHGLGKLHDAVARKKSGSLPAAEPKAMVFFQAAMLVYPKNFMAANDLGVLLARCGNYAGARMMLEHSVSLSPQPATWHNLAVVYGQLGQPALALRADQQAVALQQAEVARRRTLQGTANNSIQWVDPQTFAQTSSNAPNATDAAPRPSAQAATNPSTTPRRLPPTSASAKPSRPPTAAERMSWGSTGYQR